LILGLILASLVAAQEQTGKPAATMTGDELRALLEKARTQHDVPAAAAGLVRAGEQPLVVAVGVRKRGTDIAATVDDQWHIGSNTKPMTALLVALLIEQGQLDWDTPLADIFPDQAEKWSNDVKKITPAQLLTHTSGLPSIGPLMAFLVGRSEKTPIEDRDNLVHSLETVKLVAKPGEKYQYSNLGYIVLGAIVDKRGQAPWEEQLEKKVFQPLGIKDGGLGPVGKKDAVVQPWPHHNNGKPAAPDAVIDNPPVMNSAGRVHLTVADYNRYLAETLKLARGEKGLLKPATAQKVFSNPYPVSPHSLSGWVGFRKEAGAKGLVLAHDGSNTFNYCTAVVVPDQKLAFCVLTNQGSPGGPGHKLCQQVSKELLGRK
jgi:CubicO group peptidase (beta-lactamase class C family)